MTRILAALFLVGCSGSPEKDEEPGTTPDTDTVTTDTLGTGDTGTETTPPLTSPSETHFIGLLERQFTVQHGGVGTIEAQVCCSWESCWKRNPSSDYGIYLVPPAPGESLAGRELNEDGLQFNYRLRHDEAVVFVGRTPPALKYYSFRTYAHDRDDGAGGRVKTFTSLGDSINQFAIGTVEPDPFDALTMLVTTADVGVFEAIKDAAIASGFPGEVVNFDSIPADLVTLGLHSEADTFRMNLRMAGFVDPAVQQMYVDAADGVVLRVTPEDGQFDPQPYAPGTFRFPGTGTNEDHLAPAVEELRQAILAEHADMLAAEPATNIRELEPDADCWGGCNRDASMSNTPHFTLPIAAEEEFLVVYGVNHEASGKSSFATAMVVGIFNDDSAAVVDSIAMPGSAEQYLPDHPDASKLYAWKFRRNCAGDPYCSEVTVTCPGLAAGEHGSIHWRAYAEAATGTRPMATELLPDHAIKFVAEPTTTSTTGL